MNVTMIINFVDTYKAFIILSGLLARHVARACERDVAYILKMA